MQRISKFQRTHGSQQGSVYKCQACGKMTRETGDGESGCSLCAKCYYESGLENEHSDDGHEEYNPDCPTCRLERVQGKI